MSELNTIRQHIIDNGIAYGHYTLAQFIKRKIPEANELSLWLAVLVNLEIDRANVCLDIAAIRHRSEAWGWPEIPGIDELQDLIASSPVFGQPGEQRPLIMDRGRLYLHRFYHYELAISEHLLSRCGQQAKTIADEQIATVDRLFPGTEDADKVDMQKIAAIVSSLHPLAIISGGPGTGKTYTVSRILALLLDQHPDIRVQLTAPTGKAAMRLSQSIIQLSHQLAIDDATRKMIPQQAVTLHRLLAIDRYSHRPRFNQDNPLDCDLLVVDEASMIDQQMMAMLTDALPDTARLILLGDKDQLSSVEAGSIFADLCGELQHTSFNSHQQQLLQQTWQYSVAGNQSSHALADQLVVLDKSHRFDESSTIGRLADCINRGQSQDGLHLLSKNQEDGIRWRQVDETDLPGQIKHQVQAVYRKMMGATDIDQAFVLFHQYQILSAVWSGPAGVDNVNRLIEQYLKQDAGIDAGQQYYQGMPLMMTRNVYQYDLYNGDIGIIWPDQDQQLKIWFETGSGEYRVLSLSQLPQHQTAYAMTVHKSQGSEFEHVLMLFPYQEVEVLTRELFYTAITRAAKSVEIWGQADIIERTIERKTLRESGLMQRLQDPAMKP